MSLIFDITTKENAYKFLYQFLNIDKETIDCFIKRNPIDYNISKFIGEIESITENKIKDKSVKDINLVVLHMTTNPDNCEAIKQYGLLNLQQSLTLDTPLKKYLSKFGIEFDIFNKIMFIGTKEFIIKDNDELLIKRESALVKINIEKYINEDKYKNLNRKIYEDHQINGFFYIDDFKNYGGNVHSRPEILCNISKVFKGENENQNIESDWVSNENNKSYIIKFKAPISYFEYHNFYNKYENYESYRNKEEYELDYKDKDSIKYWMIEKAFEVVHSNFFEQSSNKEIFACMKKEVHIPYSNIIEIIPNKHSIIK